MSPDPHNFDTLPPVTLSGWCTSLENCASRAKSQTGSSKGIGSETDLEGMVTAWGGWYLSNDTAINPMMASWTKVMVQYCDGGSWSGNNASITSHGTQQLHFRGRKKGPVTP